MKTKKIVATPGAPSASASSAPSMSGQMSMTVRQEFRQLLSPKIHFKAVSPDLSALLALRNKKD